MITNINKILVICPSHKRPQAAAELVKSFIDKSGQLADIMIVCEEGELSTYSDAIKTDNRVTIAEATPGTRGMVRPLNQFATEAAKTYFSVMFVGDDHRFRSKNWDKDFIFELNKVPLVYANDLFQRETLPTACAVRSDVIQALGYMALPSLRHLYVDNYWLALGKKIGIKYCVYLTIEHMHPAAGKGTDDEHYAAVNSNEMYTHDQKEFERFIASEGVAQEVWRYKVYLENQVTI